MYRKTLLTCALVTVAAVTPAAAQTSFGIVGGLVSANVSISPDVPSGITKSSRTGGAAGVFMKHDLTPEFAIAPEAFFIMKGYQESNATETFTAKLNDIEVPVLLRYTLAGSGSTHFFVTAGPVVSFKISCKQEFTGEPSQDCNQASDPTSGVKSTDFEAMFGAGVAYDRLSASVRYDLGLTNVSRDNTAGAATFKTRALLVFIGVSFGK